MKPVLVSVQSIQRDPEGQELKIELVSEGKYYVKDGYPVYRLRRKRIDGNERRYDGH